MEILTAGNAYDYRGERIGVVTLGHFLTDKHIKRVDFLNEL